MPKSCIKDMSTSGLLILTGPCLIIVYSSCGLATALGIFYFFFGITTAFADGKRAIISIHCNNTEQCPTIPIMISDRLRLAQEKQTFNQIAIEQLNRQARIRFFEDRVADQTKHPFRNLPS
jgi:hypothetical protein